MSIPDSSWSEPFSTAKPQYPYNNVKQTRGGHLFEMDDTPDAQRVRLQHGTANNFIEWQADGTGITKIFGNGYQITMANNNVYIGGQCNITVVGPSVMHVQGDSYIQVDGNVNQTVGGEGDVDMSANGALTLSSQSMLLNSDLTVNGSVTALGGISAVSSISTSTGSVLAPLGSVAVGIKALTPAALVPGNIYDAGPLATPDAATLSALRTFYDTHTHIATGFGVPTAPPVPLDPSV